MKLFLSLTIASLVIGLQAQTAAFQYQFNLFYPSGDFKIAVHPMHDTLTKRNEFTPFLQTVSLSYDHDLKPYLRLRPSVLFEWRNASSGIANGLKYYESNDSMVIKEFEALQGSNIYNYGIGISAVIDAFFKNPNEALNLILGVNFKHFRKNESYIERWTDEDLVYQEIDLLYKGLTVNFKIGVEREVFVTEHFGFSLGINWDLPYTFSPSTLEVRKLVENFEEGETATYRYDKSLNTPNLGSRVLPQESITARAFSVNASLKYRF